ncbi:MAG TPA: hypothetical protein VF623_00415 [Segetibacter sp.]|jgi:hypothetical protein
MTAIRKIIENSSSSITIDLPDEYINKKIEVLILPIEESSDAAPKRKYDFSDFYGKLEWEGDALAEQRKLRDEWD